jgi:L,D-peptidoglycan transpeptidase YkuD (ErfK/YbiS/YcfS/YnhG family)
MSRAVPARDAGEQSTAAAGATSTPLADAIHIPAVRTSQPISAAAAKPDGSASVTTSSPATRSSSPPATRSATPTQAARSTAPKAQAKPALHSAPKAQAKSTPAAAKPRGQALPLGYGTGSATRVITVTARSTGSTTGVLQAWNKAPGGGWLKYGAAVTAHIGSQGMSASPSESRSATPMGSFTLTQAFGRDADPGTALPYLKTTPSDWWISQSGSLYNTHQRCSSACPFNQGSPNEHLYYETPYYDYAVVIDYNTRNAGVVRQGAGSAFFLHVTDGAATAGCVAVPQAQVVRILRWLQPADHPRILIGVN